MQKGMKNTQEALNTLFLFKFDSFFLLLASWPSHPWDLNLNGCFKLVKQKLNS